MWKTKYQRSEQNFLNVIVFLSFFLFSCRSGSHGFEEPSEEYVFSEDSPQAEDVDFEEWERRIAGIDSDLDVIRARLEDGPTNL